MTLCSSKRCPPTESEIMGQELPGEVLRPLLCKAQSKLSA